MEYRDYYAILGVPRTATQADIKKAFRKLARQYHPDTSKGKPGAEQRFKEVNEANEVLSDPQKRQAYDQLGANWTAYQQAAGAGMPFEEFLRQARSGGASGGGFGGGFPGGSPGAGFRGPGGFAAGGGFPGGIRFEYRGSPEDLAGFSDFFRAMFGSFGSGFDPDDVTRTGGATGRTRVRAARAPGGQAPGRQAPGGASGGRPGGASGFELFGLDGLGLDGLDLEGPDGTGATGRAGHARARTGASARGRPRAGDIEVDAEVTLEEVESGTARLLQLDGSRLEVKIPAGVADGQRIRLSGKAGAGPGAGDIYVRVKVAPHRAFGREGANLTGEVRVTLGEALLGHDVPVETLSGKRLLLTVPAGTQPGRIFRLRGQGLPRFRADGRGDLLVHVRVVLPSDLTEGQRELAERFLDAVKQPDPRSPDPRNTPGTRSGRSASSPPEAGTRP
jgi:molecular chaperone DnaJ